MLRPAEIRAKFKALADEYGWVAFVVWFGVFGATLFTTAALIELGVDWPWLTEKAGSAGTWAAAYVVTKLLGPIRFGIFAAILPFAGRWKKSREANVLPPRVEPVVPVSPEPPVV